ncbi:MAG: BNR/Asp-box repeat protein, partial [Candidatus Eremiobacteraeota bacterium]|nr:BNR/Asp-box repeat protein [Candidatus Eremiobacteraeota bacterium]
MRPRAQNTVDKVAEKATVEQRAVIVRIAVFARCIALAVLASAVPALAAPVAPPPLDGVLHWRAIGPFRGGRTVAVSGVPGRPNTFFIAAVNGGIFKTTDA